MRILHTADWHLGITLNNASLFDEQSNFIDFLIDKIEFEKIDAVIIAGDIFDSAISKTDAINLYNRAVTSICRDLKKPVFIAAGNHDGAVRIASCSKLLEKSELYISGKISKGIKPFIYMDTAFHILPFFTSDEVRYLYPEFEIRNYSEAMELMIRLIKQEMVEGKKNILIAHCFVKDAVLSESDVAAKVGGSTMIPAGIFEGFDYVALGHLHMAQKIRDNVRYSGSPLKYSFGEANQRKSLTILDTETMNISEIEVVPLRDIRVITGGYEELIRNAENDNQAEKDAYIKIEITDDYATGKLDTFRSLYPNLLSLIGKSLNAENQTITLSVDEISQLSPKDIVKKFYIEIVGEEIDEELLSIFEKAGEQL